MMLNHSITDVPGILVGHAQNEEALTGCTVVLCEMGAIGGVDQRGGAPGTRQTDAMEPSHLVQTVHAVLLSGGSAFGLDAAGGVMRYLEGRHTGFDVGVTHVPIVPTAVLFDLNIGRSDIRPASDMGYKACMQASRDKPAEGNFGAGCGATVGKILGIQQAMKSGIGTSSILIGDEIIIGAIAAVNAFGDVIHPQTGQIAAGARSPSTQAKSSEYFADTMAVMSKLAGNHGLGFANSKEHTVIGVIATNARMTKEQITKVSQMAHDGLARTISPAHTMLDGDTIFALSYGEIEADVNIVGAYAARVFAEAILRAVYTARGTAGLPAVHDLPIQNQINWSGYDW